ncbi:succinate dehydrogenase cytochrome b560 subunit, mitochondrial-like [Lineus longissimus]|uniref:succinate dehydrogenase cytochrome b560 subunit, mitochondrial-like n=1 Tax=Lineus longissimus TaxID=88925 RepID=UPI002B4C7E00
MALTLLRAARGASLMRRSTSLTFRAATISMNPKSVEEQKQFWEKNEVRLKRPMSPYMTTFNFGFTSGLSIMNRATGMALTGIIYVLPPAVILGSGDFASYAHVLTTLPMSSAIIFTTKLFIAMPFVYHTLAGLRHMAWDLGFGFKIKEVYMSGYTLIAATVVGSLALALL